MYYIIGQNKKTNLSKKISEHKNLIDCYRELDRLRAKYGDKMAFFWRTTLRGVDNA